MMNDDFYDLSPTKIGCLFETAYFVDSPYETHLFHPQFLPNFQAIIRQIVEFF